MPLNQPTNDKAEPSSPSRRNLIKSTAAAALFSALGTNYAHAQGTDRIKVGLVGCGGRGRGAAGNIAEADPKGVTITAIADLFPDAIDETKKLWAEKPKDQFDYQKNIFTGFDAYQQLLNTDCNYVILATPPGFRAMMIEAAINAGKNVFGEKPVAVDPTGVRRILAAAEVASKKNLGIVCGTQRRHDPGYVETVKRIHDGQIGKVVAGFVYWNQGYLKNTPRQPGWSDMEYQIRNWTYFTWLSGDHIVEQHMHQVDVANWVVGTTPRLAIAMGGRQVRIQPEFGHIYDHFATDYAYRVQEGADDVRVASYARQIDNTYGKVEEYFIGTDGAAYASGRITGKNAWRYSGARPNPYVQEHLDFVNSIRAGKPLNEGKTCAESTLSAIMGRMSAYTGQAVTWDFALNKSKLNLLPEKLSMDSSLPEPKVAMPGMDKLI